MSHLHVGCNHPAVISFAWCRYRVIEDRAGWLTVNKDTGVIKVKSLMDRESIFVEDDKYKALIGAYDSGRLGARLELLTLTLLYTLHDY